jgi:hypothetical protein
MSDTAQLSYVKSTIEATWSVIRRRKMMQELGVNNSRLLGVAGFLFSDKHEISERDRVEL